MNKLLCAVFLSLSLVGCAKKEGTNTQNNYSSSTTQDRVWMERISENNNYYLDRFVDCDAKTVVYSLSSGLQVIPQSEVDQRIFDNCKGN